MKHDIKGFNSKRKPSATEKKKKKKKMIKDKNSLGNGHHRPLIRRAKVKN